MNVGRPPTAVDGEFQNNRPNGTTNTNEFSSVFVEKTDTTRISLFRAILCSSAKRRREYRTTRRCSQSSAPIRRHGLRFITDWRRQRVRSAPKTLRSGGECGVTEIPIDFSATVTISHHTHVQMDEIDLKVIIVTEYESRIEIYHRTGS